MLWLQIVRLINAGNLNSVGCKAGAHLKNKKREYLKDKINALSTHHHHESLP
jgi:hypothetical protein